MGTGLSTKRIKDTNNYDKTLFKGVDTNLISDEETDIKLLSLNHDDIPNVLCEGLLLRAKVIDIYDGDTITVIFFVGCAPIKMKILLLGIDTPEIRHGKNKLRLEKIAGFKCRDFLISLIGINNIVNLNIRSWDKYGGRMVGDIFLDDVHINSMMITQGYALPYDGGKKHKWNRKDLNNIINKD